MYCVFVVHMIQIKNHNKKWILMYPGVKDTESLALLWYDDIDDDEEEQELVQPTSSRQKREDLKDPDYKMPSRLEKTPL